MTYVECGYWIVVVSSLEYWMFCLYSVSTWPTGFLVFSLRISIRYRRPAVVLYHYLIIWDFESALLKRYENQYFCFFIIVIVYCCRSTRSVQCWKPFYCSLEILCERASLINYYDPIWKHLDYGQIRYLLLTFITLYFNNRLDSITYF